MQRRILWKTVAILISVAVMGVAAADDENARWTANFALGYQQWNAVGDLDTQPLGSFDDGGWNAVGSVNRRWREVGRGDLSFGMDLGFMSNDSNIRAPGDIGELAADVFFLTPSMTLSFGGRRSARLNLEVGAGLDWAEHQQVRANKLNLSLTWDHRVLDGAPAAEFLAEVSTLLSNPYRLLV